MICIHPLITDYLSDATLKLKRNAPPCNIILSLIGELSGVELIVRLIWRNISLEILFTGEPFANFSGSRKVPALASDLSAEGLKRKSVIKIRLDWNFKIYIPYKWHETLSVSNRKDFFWPLKAKSLPFEAINDEFLGFMGSFNKIKLVIYKLNFGHQLLPSQLKLLIAII